MDPGTNQPAHLHQAREDHVCGGSTGITNTGLHCPAQGLPNNRLLQVCDNHIHGSGFTYMHLQCCITSDKTVSAKKAFEQYATQIGGKIAHYHVDNGQFADHGFVKAFVRRKKQSISYILQCCQYPFPKWSS